MPLYALRFTALFLLLCLTFAVQTHAAPYRVVEVVDGGTLTVEPTQGGDRVKVRLHGIVTPEANQPYGQAATVFVINSVLYKTVDVRPTQQDKDGYGRVIATVEVPGAGILQEMLLTEGLAQVDTQDCKDCGAWEGTQAEAKEKRKGLWAGNPVEPRDWKRELRKALSR